MSERPTFTNPVVAGAPGEDHGDPFVIKYLDSFFLYHTGETHGRRGVSVHRSQNLVDWEFQGYAVEPAEAGWAWSDLWAPEVVYERGTFYMYVSATRRRTGPPGRWDEEGEGDEAGRRVGIARATSPLGPFVWDPHPLLESWAIDGHPFRDDDGSMWLFYSSKSEATHLPGAQGTGTDCDRLLAPDRLEGRPTPVTYPSQPWEGPYRDWYWNEGPYVLKRRGTYFQLYSGGFYRDASYAVGVASAPTPRGPWRKNPDNPIFSGSGRIVGPGHNSFVYGPDVATRYAVYHSYLEGEEGRKVCMDRLRWTGDEPRIVGPTDGRQPVPPSASFDPCVPHWRAEAWARGSWVEVAGARYGLEPDDAWHQVEAVQADGRVAVRVGGVLRASRPSDATCVGPAFAAERDLTAETVTSYLEDGTVHVLPAGSEHVWRWGGGGRLEVTLAVRGEAELDIGGTTQRLEGEDEYRLVHVAHEGATPEITVRAGSEGVTVADLFVYGR
jgi:GH43 family beta-xylosidase